MRPTWFEVLTLAAFRWFADVPVDVVVLEVGMAGRWDATNVADGIVAVVTNVGLDHTAMLGPTRAHIAAEKAGIVKPGSTLVLGETDPELGASSSRPGPGPDLAAGTGLRVDRQPAGRGRPLPRPVHPGRSATRRCSSRCTGAHQGDNAACAVAAAEAFFERSLAEDVVREALEDVAVPGRFEVVRRRPLVVLDGAHNLDGARTAAATVDDLGRARASASWSWG